MHFGKEKDNEKLNKNRENAENDRENKYTSAKHTHIVISSMKRHGGARGKGPTSIHRASFGTVCAHITKAATEMSAHDENKRQQAS